MHSQCQGCAEHIKESEWGESCAHPQVHLHPCHHDRYKRRQAFAETSPRLWRFPLHVSSKLNGIPWPCGEIALTRPQRDRKRLAFHNISKGLLYDPAVTYPCCARTRTQGQDSSVPLFQDAAVLFPETKPRSGFFSTAQREPFVSSCSLTGRHVGALNWSFFGGEAGSSPFNFVTVTMGTGNVLSKLARDPLGAYPKHKFRISAM